MRATLVTAVLATGLLAAHAPATAQTAPPYSGTIFLDPDIVTPADLSFFQGATYTGRGLRTVYDRRSSSFVQINAYLFALAYSSGRTIEAQINPEFGSEAAARTEAETYGRSVGQLPIALRRDVDALWIHRGVQPFGGGNRSLLIHTGQSAIYVQSGILEETLIHEAAHTSLDADHAASARWVTAQSADPRFISTYARDNPQSEDVAESFLPYLAVRYRRGRISQDYYDTVSASIPNRIAYFDAQRLDLGFFATAAEAAPAPAGMTLSVVPNPVAGPAILRITLDRPRDVRIDVIDVLGRRVAEVSAGVLPAGDVAVPWSAAALRPGVYLLRVIADGVLATRPVTVVR